MWKYVTRRLKESFERTCNTLDSYRTWRCKASNSNGLQNNNDACCSTSLPNSAEAKSRIHTERDCVKIFNNLYVCVVNPESNNSSSKKIPGIGYKGAKKEKFNDNHANSGNVHNDVLGVITWSGAIIFGWYASQLLCLQSRYGKRKAGYHVHPMVTTSRAIHTNIVPCWVPNCSIQSPHLSEKITKEKFILNPLAIQQENYNQTQFTVVTINNENESDDATASSPELSSSTYSSGSSQKQSADEAVSDLVKFLGETEFKLAIQYISAGQYRSAVTHLKLASRHRHVGATFNLGLCYEQGLGVTKSLKRAMECYQYASSVGHPKAMYNLGVYYAKGLGGLKKDHVAARQCFIAAAKLGQNEAKIALGWPQIEGTIQSNDDEAIASNISNAHFIEINNRNVITVLNS